MTAINAAVPQLPPPAPKELGYFPPEANIDSPDETTPKSTGGGIGDAVRSLGDRWQSFIRSQSPAVRVGIATTAGAVVGGGAGMLFGPVGGAVGAVAGAGFMFFTTSALSQFM